MTDTHKLMARVVDINEISRFELAPGEDLDTRVVKEIEAAAEAGKLGRMATRVGLPAIAVSEVGQGEGIGGGENNVSVALYAPDGSPLVQRRFRVDTAENGTFVAIAMDDDVNTEVPIGVFADHSVAEQVALFWRNGHLNLPQ